MVEFMEWRPMGDKVKVSPGWHQACFSGEFDMWRQDDVSWAPRVEREGFAKAWVEDGLAREVGESESESESESERKRERDSGLVVTRRTVGKGKVGWCKGGQLHGDERKSSFRW